MSTVAGSSPAALTLVELRSADVLLPMSCTGCMAENPDKSYETTAKRLVGMQYIPGGRQETWRTYKIRPRVCSSCHQRLF